MMKFKTAAITTAILSISGCTVNLPPSNAPIPAADPIIIPEKSAKTAPASKAASTTTEKTGKAESPKPTEKTKETDRQGQLFYVVKSKDTVFEVMRKTGVHWKEIIRLNDLKAPDYTIFPGQSLRIK